MGIFHHIKSLMEFTRLNPEEKQIVFYSEGKTYWPHLEGLLKEFLDVSDYSVCYVSSHSDDPGLAYQHPNLKHFLIDEGFLRNWFFENLQCTVLVTTMPDLHQYQVKRSKFPVHYVYVQHSMVSKHMVYRPGAFDHFDTIFCGGPHHKIEIRALEKHHNLKEKNLVEHGYGRLDSILSSPQAASKESSSPSHILIAPSWGDQAMIETVGSEVVSHLLENGYQLTLRPHPQTVKFSKDHLDRIANQHKGNPLFNLELDVSGQKSLHDSDLMISDWSGAALDYAFGLEKPVVFIDVARKVNNPSYEEIPVEPFEVMIREKIGHVVSPEKIGELDAKVKDVLKGPSKTIDFQALRNEHLYNPLQSAKVGAINLNKICDSLQK